MIFSGDSNIVGGRYAVAFFLSAEPPLIPTRMPICSLILNPSCKHYLALKQLLVTRYEDIYHDEDAISVEHNSQNFSQRAAQIDANAECVRFTARGLAGPQALLLADHRRLPPQMANRSGGVLTATASTASSRSRFPGSAPQRRSTTRSHAPRVPAWAPTSPSRARTRSSRIMGSSIGRRSTACPRRSYALASGWRTLAGCTRSSRTL